MTEQPVCRISQLNTSWSLVRQAHDGTSVAMIDARRRLVERYAGAVERYLRAAISDVHKAEDLSQKFAEKVLSGAFHRADSQKGRFRDFLKTALWRMVSRERYKNSKELQPLPAEFPEPADSLTPPDIVEAQFIDCWRAELLARAWDHLKSDPAGQIGFRVLRRRVENSELTYQQHALELSAELGRPFTDINVRQIRHRAGLRFAEFLIEEVAQSLDKPTRENLTQELIDLKLLKYCQVALDQYLVSTE
jgi:DNA-directed RNA polymerase specialized sigma24 family protein